MNINLDQKNPVKATMKVQIPAEVINDRLNSYYTGLAKKVRVPGFRPGKAPTAVVKKMYAGDSAADLSERLISEFVFHAVKEKGLELVLPPVLLATDLPQENQVFNFEVEIDLKPKLPTIEVKGITVEVPEGGAATDEEVEAELNRLRDQDASFRDITESRPAADGDYVVVSFNGTLNGEPQPGMQSDSQTFVLGQKQFLPEFEQAVLGLKVGESKKFDLPFPADYHAQELQGKTAQFEVTLKELKEKVLPALDDEFAKQADSEVSSLTELKEKIRKQILEHKERVGKEQTRERLGDALVEKYPFEVSPRQVEMFAQRLAEQTHQMMHQMGVQHEENEEHFNSLMNASKKKAERDVRLSYILEALAKQNKLEVKPEDFEARFEQTAKKTGLSVSQIRAYYAGKDEENGASRMDRLKIDILDEKSLDYALSQVTMKNKGSK